MSGCIIINGVEYELKCGMHACDKNLHSFTTNKTLQRQGIEKGCCVGCKSKLVDWERLYKKRIFDFEYLKGALKLEMIRNVFWSIKTPTESMKEEFRTKSEVQIRTSINKRLKTTLEKPKCNNQWDGRQTPFEGKLIYWAQHATGTCCRKCLEEWYGIPADNVISEEDFKYLEEVVMKYIEEKRR